jgi:RNA polymerase sigma-70 factor (ECF subfamily)
VGYLTRVRAPASLPGGESALDATGTPSFPEIYREHAPFVWRSLRRLGVRVADLDDVCQEAFLVVHRRLSDFDGSHVKSWLFAIAMRCASDHRRRAHVRREAPTATPPDSAVPPDQGERLDRAQARALLDRVLDDLDEDRRAVFVLFELEQLSMAEVARAVGCPLQTAYSRLHAAREKIQAAVHRLKLEEQRR